MSFIASIVQWTQATFEPLGAMGLFILAIIEAFFFPIPPDFLLIILTLAKPEFGLLYAAVATVGTTIGGAIAYGIGWWGEQNILERLFAKKKINKVHSYFQKYEVWAIAVAGFTPLPYKLFAVAAGVFQVDFKKFLLATFISRGARFLLEAVLIMAFGQAIMDFLEGTFNLVTFAVIGILLIGIIIYQRKKKK